MLSLTTTHDYGERMTSQPRSSDPRPSRTPSRRLSSTASCWSESSQRNGYSERCSHQSDHDQGPFTQALRLHEDRILPGSHHHAQPHGRSPHRRDPAWRRNQHHPQGRRLALERTARQAVPPPDPRQGSEDREDRRDGARTARDRARRRRPHRRHPSQRGRGRSCAGGAGGGARRRTSRARRPPRRRRARRGRATEGRRRKGPPDGRADQDRPSQRRAPPANHRQRARRADPLRRGGPAPPKRPPDESRPRGRRAPDAQAR